jgi:hypothetical protein
MIVKNLLKRGLFFILIFILTNNFIMPTGFCINIAIYDFNMNNKNFYGNILFTPLDSTKTYLLNMNNQIVHIWNSNYFHGMGVHLFENGYILRSDMPYINPTFFKGGGITGRVELLNWEGDIIWEFELSNNQYCLHHDIEPLPNGNILMIVWETKTRPESIAAGRNPNLVTSNGMWPDYIIEVEPTGLSGGNIVWEWHVWDHLIQDFDNSKDNYGIISDHPELVDINCGELFPYNGDWNHINSIDYNEDLDQILLSIRNFGEIWVIDHSTTTEEAAGHSGGRYGKGGDLLYRWGNPINYGLGVSIGDQRLFRQHDARWIKSGCPGEGNILIFNNGNNRPGSYYSSVDEIIPPVDINGSYYLETDGIYGPKEPIWCYTDDDPTDFYAYYLGGAQRLPNGNTLICDGSSGRFFEVTPEKIIIWEYINPYPSLHLNDVFTIQFYPFLDNEEPDLDCEGSLQWIDVKRMETVYGIFSVQNIGTNESKLKWKIKDYPDWGVWSFYPESGENLSPEDNPINIQASVIIPNEKDKTFEGFITVENQENPNDYDVIPVFLKITRKININNINIERLLTRLNIEKTIFKA